MLFTQDADMHTSVHSGVWLVVWRAGWWGMVQTWILHRKPLALAGVRQIAVRNCRAHRRVTSSKVQVFGANFLVLPKRGVQVVQVLLCSMSRTEV